MTRSLLIIFVAALLLPGMAQAGWVVWDWSANFDGTTYNPDPLPSTITDTGFSTGLGSLMFDFNTSGAHYAGVYLYAFYDGGFGNTTDAYGTVTGNPDSGLSYELRDPNEPGVYWSLLWENFSGNALTNTNNVPAYSPPDQACCEVGLAEIYHFSLAPGYTARVTFNVGPDTPSSPFFLQVTDHDQGESIYLTQSFDLTAPPPSGVPEPASWLLITAGAGLLCASRRRN